MFKIANYDSDVHPENKKFWKNLPKNKNETLGKHPVFTLEGEKLDRASFEHTKKLSEDRKINHTELGHLFMQIIALESSHKKELEDLAISAVSKLMGIDKSELKAKITNDIEINDTEPLTPKEIQDLPQNLLDEANKRITSNAFSQGASVHGYLTAHFLDEIESKIKKIDPKLFDAYSKLTAGSHHLYWLLKHQKEALAGQAVGSERPIQDKEGNLKVDARGALFVVLVQELIKGVVELRYLKGLQEKSKDELSDDDIQKIFRYADQIKDEPKLIQIGPELWRRFLKVYNKSSVKKGRTVSEVYEHLMKLSPKELHNFVQAVVNEPEQATKLLNNLITENVTNIDKLVQDILKQTSTIAPAPVKTPTTTPTKTPIKQPRIIPLPKPKNFPSSPAPAPAPVKTPAPTKTPSPIRQPRIIPLPKPKNFEAIIDNLMHEAKIHLFLAELQDQQLINMVGQFTSTNKDLLQSKQDAEFQDKYNAIYSELKTPGSADPKYLKGLNNASDFENWLKKNKKKFDQVNFSNIKKQYFDYAKKINTKIIQDLKPDQKSEKLILIWLLQQVAKKNIPANKIIEDAEVIQENLKLYLDNQKKINKNLYDASYDDLKNWITPFRPEGEEGKIQTFLSKPHHDGGTYKIYKITEVGQCIKIGKGTSWCIQGEQWAKNYLKKGPLWLITKNGKRFALFSFESGQFMDVNDRALSKEKMFPILDAWPEAIELIIKNLKTYPRTYQYLKDVDEKTMLDNIEAFEYFNNPSEKVQKLAIEKNPKNIQYIEKPSDDIQDLAISKDPNIFNYIKNPKKGILETVIKHLDKNPHVLEHIIDHVPENIIEKAITLDPTVIRYIKNPSKKILDLVLEHVDKNPEVVRDLKIETDSAKLEILKKAPFALQFFRDPSEDLQKEAVKRNGKTIKFINKPSVDVQKLAIENTWLALGYIKNPDKSVIERAIQINPKAKELV